MSARKERKKGEEKKPATVIDIANLAGVAPMTVSRVVNNSGYVSREMREKVERVIKELNYQPNGLARSLKKQSTEVVGILLPDIANPFSAELVSGIQETLIARGYTSFISVSERSVQREQAALQSMVDHRVDGIIVATRETRHSNELLSRIIDRGLPVVAVGRILNHPYIDRVTADHWKGGYDAIEHLISLGHRRIGFIGVSQKNGAGLQRYQGYLSAMKEHRLPIDENLIVGPASQTGPGYSTQEDGYEGMKILLDLKKKPTAVFARNDFTAIGAMCAARDAGLTIPEDIAIVGFDNVPLAAYTAPPLTTVDQPTKWQGHEAAGLLLDRIEGDKKREKREIYLNCRLVIRQSTASK